MISETQAVKCVVERFKKGRRPNKLRDTTSRVTGKNKNFERGTGRSIYLGGIALKMINDTAPKAGGGKWAERNPDAPRHASAYRRLKTRIGKKLAQPFRRKPRRKAKASGKNNVRPQRGMRR